MRWILCIAMGISTANVVRAQQPPTAELVIADLEDRSLEGWQSSMSGEYYEGGHGQKGLAIVDDAERGGPVLEAKVRWLDTKSSEPVFITRFLSDAVPAHLIDSISFSYRLSSYHLNDDGGFIVRLRYSPTSFTDYRVSTGEPLPAGEWQDVALTTAPDPTRRNIYNSLFGSVQEITFRLDDVDAENAEFELRVDDVRFATSEPTVATYAPTVHDRSTDEQLSILYLKHSAEGFFRLEDAVTAAGGDSARIDTCLFRGLHFPLWGFPETLDATLAYDLIVMLDVDPYVLTHRQAPWVADAVASGVGLLFVAGPNTLRHSKDFKAPIREALPITYNAEAGDVGGGTVTAPDPPHIVLNGLDVSRLGRVRSMTSVEARSGATVALTSGEKPLLVVSELERGRTAVLTTWPQIDTPRSRQFYLGDHSPALLERIVRWLVRDESAPTPAPPARVAQDAGFELDGYVRHGRTAFAPGWPVQVAARLSVPGIPVITTSGMSAAISLPDMGLRLDLPAMADVWVLKPGSDEVYHSMGGGEVTSHELATEGFLPRVVTEAILRATRTDGNVFGEDNAIAKVRRQLEVRPGGTVACAYEYEFLQDTRVHRMPLTVSFAVGMYAGTPFRTTGPDGDREDVLPPDASERRDTVLDAQGLDITLETEAGPLRIRYPEPDRRAWLRDLRRYDMDQYRLELGGPLAGQAAKQGDRYVIAFEIHPPASAAAPSTDGLRLTARLLEGDSLESATAAWEIGTEPADVEVAFEDTLPNLESGQYWLSYELARPGEEALATDAVSCWVVDPLDRSRFFPIMSLLGVSAGGHMLDEAGVAARADDLWRVGFNTLAYTGSTRFAKERITRASEQLDAFSEGYAFAKGMASIHEYTHTTRLSRNGSGDPSPFSPDSLEATRRHIQPYLTVADGNPRLISVKVIDEPLAGIDDLNIGEHARRAFKERYGEDLRPLAEVGDDPLARLHVAQFIGDYVAEEYRQGHAIKREVDRDWDLLLTYCSPGLGYGRAFSGQEDVLKWSRHVDRIDFDVYPYFYPASQKIRMVQANYCQAFQRNVAQHLDKPYGFYVELDDRNYPFQTNPPEASAECAYTAIGQGVTYLNSFINRPFGTGIQSRPQRWEHLARELPRIRRIGPMLLKMDRPAAPVAMLYPMTQAKIENGYAVPHYTYALLNSAFGDVDLLHEEVLLEAGISESLEALVVLRTHLLARGTFDAITRFVEGGGMLIVDGEALATDETGAPIGWPDGIVQLDGDVEEMLKEIIEGNDALSPNIADPKAFGEWHERIRGIFADGAIAPTAVADDDLAQIEVGARTNGDATLLIITNHDDEPRRADVRVPNIAHPFSFAADLREMKPAGRLLRKSGDGIRISTQLPARQSTMIALYPERPARLSISVDQSATRGDGLAYTVRVTGEKGDACSGLHLVEVAVTDADGVERARYGGSFAVEGGELKVDVPIAINAAPGEWTIRAELPVVSKTAEAAFEVR